MLLDFGLLLLFLRINRGGFLKLQLVGWGSRWETSGGGFVDRSICKVEVGLEFVDPL